MKRTFFLFAASFIFLSVSPALAVFGITTDLADINFGAADPGDTVGDIPLQALIITCTSDQGNQWFLRVYTEGPLTNLDNPSMNIPDTNFYWYGTGTNGAGTLVTDEEDMTAEKVMYTSTASEGADGVTIAVKFKLEVPRYIQSGVYGTRIIFTLTE